MTAIIDGTNGVTTPNVLTSSSGVALTLQSAGTTAVTIDTSQNVGIGTASPSYKLDVITSSNSNFIRTGVTGTNAGAGVIFQGAVNTRNNWVIANQYNVSGALEFTQTTTAGGSTIGTTPSMLIDRDGNLLIGKTTTTVSEKVGITTTTDIPSIYINPTNASLSSTIVYINTTRAASAGFDFYGGYANSVGQFRVTGLGVIFAQNTSIQSISDQRLKENIRDSSDGLSVINALRPVRYDWKEGYGNDQKNQLGFIAQEIETVFPEAVGEWQVNKDDETTYKTVGPASLIPVLVKAIQELKTIVDTQTAEIAELKAKVA